MKCPRCNGLLVRDVYVATQWAEIEDTYFYRCVQCGNAVDELIMRHQRLNVKVAHE